MTSTAADTGNTTEGPGDDDTRITADILKVAGAVVVGMIMAILDMTVVNVALPTFLTEFKVDAYSTVAWTITAYTLALAAVIPVTGWAADRFGTKRLYVTALALFTFGSILCAFAWNIEALIGFRVLQGLGGGMLVPLGMTIMTKTAGPHRMGRLMAILGVPMLLGPIAGPILGGWLIDAVSWHWIFLINLPLGVIAIVYALVVLPKDSPEPSETFDFVGMLLMSPGLALFLYGVSSIPGEGTVAATKVLVPGLVGLVLITAFVVWAFRPEHPLLDLRLFKDRNLTVATIVMFLFAGSFFGAMLLVPTYFQQVRGEDVLKAGLLVAPQGIGAMLTMPIAGTLADKIPVGRIVPVGMATALAGIIGLALSADPDTPYWRVILFLFVMGLGMGGSMMPTFTSALKTLREHQVARGSTLINVIQQVASSVGVAVMSVVLTNQQNASEAFSALRALGDAKQAGVQPPAWATETAQRLGDAFQSTAISDLAGAFETTYWVAVGAMVITLGASLLLPRRREESKLLEGEGEGGGGEGDRATPPVGLH
ncbi:DHA2 family efflux MFS transporter permease subunit [Streptomyces sp. NPDC047072]|uniref:DHA2 family efflux MFS transporter permease subunit n=1 Tax=Streptomyces sp. NPDC047072 TaxID=3154809 RepID=UPI0034030CD7